MDIHLNFINRSSDTNNAQVVIFQKNVAIPGAPVVAWKTFPAADTQEITIPSGFMASVTDAWGNEPQHPPEVTPGSVLRMYQDASGQQFEQTGQNSPGNTLTIRNDLPQGTLHARVLRGGQLVSVTHNVVPGQQAIFDLHPTTLWIGLVPTAEPGQILPPAVHTAITASLNLTGIARADLIMTDGAPGNPVSFHLSNIQPL